MHRFGAFNLAKVALKRTKQEPFSHEPFSGAKPRPAGAEAPAVTVEVHLANGLPSFTLVGLADVEVKEARERVRSACRTRAGVPAQQAHHREPGTGRPAQGFRALRPAHCIGHPGRQRPDRRRAAGRP
jgi:hypothetical protein